MPKTDAPPMCVLPPVRVEHTLHEALTSMAQRDGRSLTDLVRCMLRDEVAKRKRRERT